MADLARLVVALEAQTVKYQKGLDQANAKLRKFERTQSKLLDRVNRGFSGVSRAARLFGASLTVGAVAGFTKRSAEFAENLELMSSRLGVSARQLQAWQLIGERFGVQQNSLNTGIQRLTRRTAEAAKGMGEARSALRELGIDAQRFNSLSLDDRMLVLAQAFGEVRNEGDRVRLAFKLFDTEGVSFLQFLNEGETGLAKLRGQLEGQIWSDSERAKLSKLNQQMTELSQTIQLTFAPALVTFGGWIAGSFKYVQDVLVNYTRLIQAAGGNQAAIEKLASRLPAGDGVRKPGGDSKARTKIFREADVNPFMDKGVNTAFDAANKEVSAEFKKQNDLLIARRELMREALAPMVMTTQDSADDFDNVVFGRFDEMNAKAQAFQETFADNLVMAADQGFEGLLKSWSRTLLQMAARAASSKLFSLLGQGKEGGLFGALGGLFGGARASGGPVSAGKGYLVGEKGPELFMPRASGNIIPNGGGGVVVNQSLHVTGASRSEFIAAAAALKEQTVGEVFDKLRRSGR